MNEVICSTPLVLSGQFQQSLLLRTLYPDLIRSNITDNRYLDIDSLVKHVEVFGSDTLSVELMTSSTKSLKLKGATDSHFALKR